jgi:AcrR family transcriptional regulator
MTQEKKDKRCTILQAALEIFAENGFHGSPTSMIAEKAEVGTGTLYRYFESKDDLIRELHKEMDIRARSVILTDYATTLPIAERFFKLFSNLIHYTTANPREFRFLEQFYNSPYGIAVRQARLQDPENLEADPFVALFGEAKKDGLIINLPTEVLMALTAGPVFFLTRSILAGFIHLDEELTHSTIQALWNAIKR